MPARGSFSSWFAPCKSTCIRTSDTEVRCVFTGAQISLVDSWHDAQWSPSLELWGPRAAHRSRRAVLRSTKWISKGTTKSPSRELEDKIATRESPHFLGLFEGVVYDYEIFNLYVLQRDLQRIERYYRARGFYRGSRASGPGFLRRPEARPRAHPGRGGPADPDPAPRSARPRRFAAGPGGRRSKKRSNRSSKSVIASTKSRTPTSRAR